jgi:cysteine-rich CPCC protein
MFSQPPGSYEICSICFWEDSISELRFPQTTGANGVNLIEAQKNFARFGASELRVLSFVRLPKESELRDSEWRPIDENIDVIEEPISGTDYGRTYFDDRTQYYYWRKSNS